MSPEIAPWFVAAKVSPPRALVTAHIRQHLIERLMGGLNRSVTMIEAPAGFGKSTLLAQWRDALMEKDFRVAWVTIDEEDESEILIAYIAFAFERAGLEMRSTGLLSPSLEGGHAPFGLSRLLNHIELSSGRCVLILDELERIPEREPANTVKKLIERIPDNLHLVMACRRDPGLPLSKLTVGGMLNRMGSEDLRFSRSEIDIFYGELISEKDREYIVERTNGWPVALQLIRSVIRAGEDVHRQIRSFTGHSNQAVAYFSEQLFSSIGEEERNFLLDTSVLDPVIAAAADFIRNAADSEAIVARLGYLNSLFTPLEVEEESYRLHPLLREYLYAKLGSEFPQKFYALHGLAGEWMAQKGHVQGAIRHALAADDAELAAAFFERTGGLRIFMQEGLPRFQGALALLSGAELKGFPRVLLARSLLALRDGEPERARGLFRQAAAASDHFSRDRPGGDRQALLIERYIVELSFVGFGDPLPGAAALDEAAEFILSHAPDDPALGGFVNLRLCLARQQVGDFEEAQRLGRKAIRELRKGNSIHGELWMRFHFGMMNLARGRTGQALEDYRTAVRQARTHFPKDAVLRTTSNVLLGELFWETGDVASANRYLAHVPGQIDNLQAWSDISMAAYSSTAELLLSEQGADASLAFLDKGLERAADQGSGRLEKFISSIRISVLCLSGRGGEASLESLVPAGGAQSGGGERKEPPTWREAECLALARVRQSIRAREFDDARAEITSLADMAARTGNWRVLVKGLVHKAILEQTAGQLDAALKTLESALSNARPGNFQSPFLLEKKQVVNLLEQILKQPAGRDRGREAREFARRLLARLRDSGVSQRAAKPTLNRRELEVLTALGEGHPDKTIARTLGISVHGVRYHLRKIFFKFGVRNRLQAVARARELDLLP